MGDIIKNHSANNFNNFLGKNILKIETLVPGHLICLASSTHKDGARDQFYKIPFWP
jgi:hypothetical protein